MTKVKICGLSRLEDILAANEVKTDFVGFVFAGFSRRYVEPGKAAELKKLLSPEIKAVGVFVDEAVENVVRLVEDGVIDVVQLHGHESAEYVERLRELLGSVEGSENAGDVQRKSIIQAFRVEGAGDVEKARKSPADFVLLDAPWGKGETFDWQLLRNLDRPYFLAGALNSTNVVRAIETLRPYAVDVSSGVETDGAKDASKMREFVTGVRNLR